MYESLDNLKSTLGIPPSEGSKDVLLLQLLNAATESIDRYCNRHFYDPTSATQTARTYDAPSGPDLYTDAFSTVSDVRILVGISAIVLDATMYQKLPRNIITGYSPSYNRLRRVTSGRPWSWMGDGEGMNGVTVQVTADWLFDPTQIPFSVQMACRIMAARLYHREISKYANLSGVDANGFQISKMPIATMDPDVCGLLKSYRRVVIA